MITTIVPWITWARLGHSTFFSSAQDSRTKRPRSRGSRRPVCVEAAACSGRTCGWLRVRERCAGGFGAAELFALVAPLPTGLAGH